MLETFGNRMCKSSRHRLTPANDVCAWVTETLACEVSGYRITAISNIKEKCKGDGKMAVEPSKILGAS